MAAFAYGFRDTLEAALIIGLAVAALIRLGRGQMAQALWIGVGAGALLGFSIGTGLAAAALTANGSGWTGFEIAAMGMSVAALGGLLLTTRCFAAESGPCLWLAVATGMFAALPQTLDFVSHVSSSAGGAASVAVMVLGAALATGLAAAVSLALARFKLGQANRGHERLAQRELAPVRQRVD